MRRLSAADIPHALRWAAVAALICIVLQIAEAAYGNAPGHFSKLLGQTPESPLGRAADFVDFIYFIVMIITDPIIIFPMGNPEPSLAHAIQFLEQHSPFVVAQYFFTGFFFWFTRKRSAFFIIPTVASYFGVIIYIALHNVISPP